MSLSLDVGRIGHDEIEAARKRCAEVAGNERRAAGKPKTHGIVARDRERVGTDVGGDAEGVRQLAQQREQERARSGAEIGEPQGPPARTLGVDQRERHFHHGFGLRPRHQRCRRRAGSPAPRIPCTPTMRATGSRASRRAGELRDLRGIVVRQRPGRGRRKARMVEAERVADENAGIELGRVQAGAAKRLRQRAACVGDANAGATSHAPARVLPWKGRAIAGEVPHSRYPAPLWAPLGGVGRRAGGAADAHASVSAASSAAWCSVTSASMISPKASPAITCGSL